MVPVPRPLAGTVLCLALLATSGLSGCMDGNGRDDGRPSLFSPWRSENTEGVSPDLTRHRPAQGPCQGCIPLVPEPVAVETFVAATQRITVPYPQIGDMFRAEGRGAFKVGHLGGYSLPARDDSHTIFQADVIGMEAAPRSGDPDTPHVRIALTFFGSHGHMGTRQVEHLGHDLFVSTASRTLDVVRSYGLIRDDGSIDPIEGLEHPRLETLFWLGAHVWGRTLQAGDRFTTHWTLPGLPGSEVLTLEYHVPAVAKEGVRLPSADRHHPVFVDAVVHVTARDATGGKAVWHMYFDAATPYPLIVTEERANRFVGERGYIPHLAKEQSIRMFHRGNEPIPWDDPIRRNDHHVPPTGTFDPAAYPPALDRLPYPLSVALSDLARNDASFHGFLLDRPDRVLAEARFVTERPTADLRSDLLLRHTWTVTFLGGGHPYAWTVSRLGSETTGLPPDRTGRAPTPDHPWLYDLLAALDRPVALSQGEAAAAAYDDASPDAPTHAIYRLDPWLPDALSGMLFLWRQPEPGPVSFSDQRFVYVAEDLRLGYVTRAFVGR